jgi:outer membrane protein
VISYRTMIGASVVVLSTVVVGAVGAAEAQKFGYVDLQEVVKTSKVGKAGLADLEAFKDGRQKEIDAKQKELLKLKQDFENQQFTLSDDVKKQKSDAIDKTEIALKRLLEDSDRELRDRRNQLLSRMQNEILDVIKTVGKEKGFSLIFDKDVGVLYADQALDVTKLIIERYDQTAKP